MLRTLRLLAAALLAWPVSAASAATNDHLQCFRIKDSAAKASYTASMTPTGKTFAPVAGCKLKLPARFLCVDSVKNDVVPAIPGSPEGAAAQRYLCYRTKCPPTMPTLTLGDQFGTRSIAVRRTGLVCAPVTFVQATCSDGIANGSETGVDCGGPECPACVTGDVCMVAADCTSGVCDGMCKEATCSDGVKNGTEADVDCGGGCPACEADADCAVNSDCASDKCSAGECQTSSP